MAAPWETETATEVPPWEKVPPWDKTPDPKSKTPADRWNDTPPDPALVARAPWMFPAAKSEPPSSLTPEAAAGPSQGGIEELPETRTKPIPAIADTVENRAEPKGIGQTSTPPNKLPASIPKAPTTEIKASEIRLDASQMLTDPVTGLKRESGKEADPSAILAPIQAVASIPGKILEPISSEAGHLLTDFLHRSGIDPSAQEDKPLITLPRRMNASESANHPVVAGVVNLLHDTVGGFETPGNAVIMAFLPGSGVIAKSASLLFGSQQLADMPEQIQNAISTVNDPDATTAQKIESVGKPGVAGLLGATMIAHGLHKDVAPPADPAIAAAVEVTKEIAPATSAALGNQNELLAQKPLTEKGPTDAISITSPEIATQREVRTPVGESALLQQQGEAAQAQKAEGQGEVAPAVKPGDKIDHPLVGATGTVEKQLTTTSTPQQVPVTIESIEHGEVSEKIGRPTVTVKLSNGESFSATYGKDKYGNVKSIEEAITDAVKSLGIKDVKPKSAAPTAPDGVRVFYDDAVKAYTATSHDERFGNMHGTGATEAEAIASLNQHLVDAQKYGTWRSVEHPSGPPAPPAVTFEQFSKDYREAFSNAMKYKPSEVGSRVFAEKMAKMADEHPDWVERIEKEEEAKAATAPPAPIAEPKERISLEALGDELHNLGFGEESWLKKYSDKGLGGMPLRSDLERLVGRKFTDPEWSKLQEDLHGGEEEAGRYWNEPVAPLSPDAETGTLETDPARVQEIRNSIAEGEGILKSGLSIAGRKLTAAQLDAVKRSVESAKAKIGEPISPTTAAPTVEEEFSRAKFDQAQSDFKDMLDGKTPPVILGGRRLTPKELKSALAQTYEQWKARMQKITGRSGLTETPPPASSIGLSAPVDTSVPVKPKGAYSGARYQTDANEFKRLVEEHAHEHGWISPADMDKVIPDLKGKQRSMSTASMAAIIPHNKVLKNAYLQALKDLKIPTDRNTIKGQAEALPKLKAFLEAHAKLVPVKLEDMGEGSEFTIAGEKFTVGPMNPDTGKVTIEDGIRRKVDAGGMVKIDPGSLKAVKVSTDFGPESEVQGPKLGQTANQGDLVDSTQKDTLSLAGEVQGDPARVAAEKVASEKSKADAAALAAKQQQDLFNKPAAPEKGMPQQELERIAGKVDRNEKLTPAERKKWESVAKSPESAKPEVTAGESVSDWTSATDETPAPVEGKPATASLVNKPSNINELHSGIPVPKFANRKMSPLDKVTAEHSGKIQKSFDEARRAQREIKADVPSERRQNAISIWREAKGDQPTLQSWAAAAKGKMFRQAAIDAQTLTPKEIAVATKVGAAFDALHTRGTTFDVLRSHRDAYVPHVWDVAKPGSGWGGGMLKQRFRFSKARTFDTFFDGDQAGFKPKTLAIGKLLPAYIHEMNLVIADRQAVRDIVAGTNKDGSPMAVPRGNAKVVEGDEGKSVLVQPRTMKEADTSDYRVIADQPALANWTWASKDTAGKPVFIKSDLALHPDAYRRINAMIGQSALRQWYHDPVTGTAQIPRAIVRGLDTAQSAMKREMFGLLAPFHQVQEGTHGIGHMVNPFSHIPKVDLRDPTQLDAVNHGLMMLPDRASARVYLEGVGAKSSLLSQGIRKTGQFIAGTSDSKTRAVTGREVEAISDVIDGYQDYVFHQYIPGLKFKTYQAILGRNMKRYAEELKSGEMTPDDVKITSAEQSNAAYGHLNYALLDRNPTIQHLIQMGTLAPDFLEARSRFVGQAVKGLSSKVGTEQLKAIALLAAVQAGSAYIISNVTGGSYDPKHPFEVIYNGRRYAMRSVPEDIFSLLKDTRQFAYGRVNPLLVKGGIQLATGLNYRGEEVTALDTFEELLAGYIPITARQLPGLRSLTETSRQNPVSPLQQLAGSLGLRISRYSPVSETYKLAGKWMDSQKMERSKGSYPISKYQQLRYALEDGDLDRAKTEYEKLIKTSTPGKIATGFRSSINHPFTGKKATDKAFAETLTGYDKQLYLQALITRSNMLQSFNKLPAYRTTSAPTQSDSEPSDPTLPPWDR